MKAETDGRPQVVLDDIIYRLQRFGGASDFWRELCTRLDIHPGVRTRHVHGSVVQRITPIRAERGEIVHSSHFRVPWSKRTPCVTTIHDLTYELGLVGGGSAALNLWQRRQAVRRADVVVCISDHTRSELESFYANDLADGAVVTFIHHGRTFTEVDGDVPAGQSPPYVLYVGNRGGYKQFDRGVEAFAASGLANRGVELWCTGSPLEEDEVAAIAATGLHTSAVRSLGVVDTAELQRLYRGAHALLYPSRYEGFGLPPLDAMSLGCPVIASDSSSVTEIVADAGILVAPHDVAGFADALRSLDDDATRARLVRLGRERASQFDWDVAAAAYLDVYRSLADR